jgi:hypothetical protein
MENIHTLNDLITHKINIIPFKFVDETFKEKIHTIIRDFLPKLNKEDITVLQILTTFIVDLISFKYHFDKNDPVYKNQWMQNANRDIKGVILLLLPFIDDKENGYLLKSLQDLNHLLYNTESDLNKCKSIPKTILELPRDDDEIKNKFKYGNMALGLIKKSENISSILDLYNNEKLIYKIIHNNFSGVLQTLEIMNGKLYINWINISPLNLSNYITSDIFKSTYRAKEKFIKSVDNIINIQDEKAMLIEKLQDNHLINYNGLWFGDIYNILRNRYYEDAKKIKWLLFPYETDSKQIYLIQGLNKMLDINKIINNKYNSYDDISDTDKTYFIEKINNIINNLLLRKSINTIEIDIEILKYTLVYLFSNNTIIDDNDTEYKQFILNKINHEDNKDDFSENNNNQIKLITQQDIIKCLQYIIKNNVSILWNYIKKQVELLELSAYGKFLIYIDTNLSKIILNNYYWKPLGKTDEYIPNVLNLKNIYNISKSLSHLDLTNWVPLNKNYISLEPNTKYNFLCRINDILNYESWINISRNIKRQYINEDLTKQNIINKTKKLVDAFKQNYIYIIFEDLVCSGLLNKFTPNLHITDKTKLPQDTLNRQEFVKDSMKKLFNDNKKDWEISYYYLTNKQFKHLPKMKIDKKNSSLNDKYEELFYFDVISNKHNWSTFYAMDWISQISFFKHYIFHQIMYVTGATGQGKSTQVPKLLLYAIKCIDYKYNGKVICTQPRITPTIDNATRIAEELGVPIEETSNLSSNKIKTANYYVQYKYQKGEHIMDSYNSLTIVTDGTLYTEIIKNPTLKTTIKDKIKNTNIYDIIIIDEAHEHNTNMDLIIALCKQGCFINNQVRLIIVSATMDDDEPIYRRYFSNNKDILLFPIKYIPRQPFTNIYYELDYMDRRYHISPPGDTTQYNIEEHYLDIDILIKNQDNTINLENTALKAQEKGYEQIKKLCATSMTGEILFFAIGEKEIHNAVKYLNEILPDGNIALPYYAKLNESYKNIISNINIKISTIRNKRSNIHLEWKDTFIEDLTVPIGIYKRAIIIATNIAEASITIPTLVYVIDNGFTKVNTYNKNTGESELIIKNISESSRIQRRGRVGRTCDGVIYYMYSKDAQKLIKPEYKITQEKMEIIMLKLLGMKSPELLSIPYAKCYDNLIISDKINPYITDKMSLFVNEHTRDTNYYTIKSGLYKILDETFTINNKYNIELTPMPILTNFLIFNNGQIFDNVIDIVGIFYLIHPFENIIKRNILNEIIKIHNTKATGIPYRQFQNIIKNLYYKNLIIDPEYRLYNDIYEVDDYIPFVKTELGNYIVKITEIFEVTMNEAITLLAASAMDCFMDVYSIIECIKVISKLDNIKKKEINWNKFKEIYGNIKSDILFIHELINKLKQEFSYLYVFKINNTDILGNHYDNIIKEFIIESDKSNIPPSSYDVSLWNKLIKLKHSGLLNKEKENILKKDKSTLNIILSNIYKYKDKISYWCNLNNLNYDTIIKILEKLGSLYLNTDISNNILKWANDKLHSNFIKHLTNYTLDERIIRSFLYGHHDQFTFKFDMTSSNALYTIINSNKIIAYIEQNMKKEQTTLVNNNNSIVFYYKYTNSKLPNDTTVPIIDISFISEIKLEWLIPCSILLFNPTNIFDINSIDALIKLNPVSTETTNGQYKQEYAKSADLTKLQKVQINCWSKNYNIWDSDDTPILQQFHIGITKKISQYINY